MKSFKEVHEELKARVEKFDPHFAGVKEDIHTYEFSGFYHGKIWNVSVVLSKPYGGWKLLPKVMEENHEVNPKYPDAIQAALDEMQTVIQ